MHGRSRIEFLDIGKDYGGVAALRGVSFAVAPGSIHAVVGENGAGKSTLMKILAGATRPTRGSMLLDGAAYAPADARAAHAAGVAIVYQEFSLVQQLSVAENVFLGRWPCGPLGWLRRRALRDRAAAQLAEIGLALPPDTRVSELSVARQQMVEIAKALALEARVLVLDEPSAVLTPHELTALFDTVRRLAQRGVSVLYISHRFEEVFALADSITVLRDGAHVATRPAVDCSRGSLIAACVGRAVAEDGAPPPVAEPAPPRLSVRGLSSPGRFADISFDVRPGEILGLAGLVGAGRSALLHALFGDCPISSGSLLVNAGQSGGRHGPFRTPRAAMRAGIGLVPEDRRRQGIIPQRSVLENVLLADPGAGGRAGLVWSRRQGALVGQVLASLRVRAPSQGAPITALSGGNQQKCVLGRWLRLRRCVMLFDEPTRGVDIGAKAEIHDVIRACAAGGMAVVVASSDLPELLALAQRIGVMYRGRLAGILPNAPHRATQESLLRLATGESA